MKYILKNDISYIINNLVKYVFFILIVPVIMFFIVNNSISEKEIVNYIMGLNIKIKDSNFLEIIIYVFNVFVSLLFVISIYLKDLTIGLDNIFLRINPNKWYIYKTFLFIIFMIMVKFTQYFILFLVIKNITWIVIVNLAILDLIYILFLQFMFLIVYMSLSIFGKKKWGLMIYLIIYLFLIPKNILSFNNYNLIFLILLIFFSFGYLYIIFRKKYRNLFQNSLWRY